jgi:SpoVK/Ycf46/Vps4 family AAA+-type ATPase
VGFWYQTPNGPRRAERRIVAPEWQDIHENYASSTKAGLDAVMSGFKPSHGGQIILWHGEPGTGKTWALRALCREWRDWCSAEYIVDPDNAFGDDPSYLMQLLLSDTDEPDGKDEKWKLLILEDTGELIGEQAKAEAGQGLSRLLNVADGFLGQGLRVLVLITTNEQIQKLHPAVSRPGRAASVILFDALSSEESSKWLTARSANVVPVSTRLTLADIYAIAEEFPKKGEAKKKVGFSLEP